MDKSKVLVVEGGESFDYHIYAVFDMDHREDAERLAAYLRKPYPHCEENYIAPMEYDVNPNVEAWIKEYEIPYADRCSRKG